MSRLSDEMIEELDNLIDSLTPSERGDYEAYLDRDHPGGTPDTNSQIKYIRGIKGRRMMDRSNRIYVRSTSSSTKSCCCR